MPCNHKSYTWLFFSPKNFCNTNASKNISGFWHMLLYLQIPCTYRFYHHDNQSIQKYLFLKNNRSSNFIWSIVDRVKPFLKINGCGYAIKKAPAYEYAKQSWILAGPIFSVASMRSDIFEYESIISVASKKSDGFE